jgi:hypothetical protein
MLKSAEGYVKKILKGMLKSTEGYVTEGYVKKY